ELARVLGGRPLLVRCLMTFAYAWLTRGRLAEAIDCFTETLAHARGLDQSQTTALCLGNLAWASVVAGDTDRAAELIAEARAIYREHPDPQRVAALHYTAGLLAVQRNDLPPARQEFTAALRILGIRGSGTTPFALEGLGVVALRDGHGE